MSYGTDKPIIIWAYSKYIEIINKAIEQYQNIDSGILFEVVEKIPSEMEHELDGLIATQGELPNIILVNDQEIERYIKKYPRLFSNLDDYIDKSAFREFKAKNITFRGSIYACPCSNDQEALFYRKDVLMNYLGLEELPEELTWDDYMELGVQLKENGFEYFLPPVHFLAESILQSTGKLYYDSNGVVSSNNVYETLSLIDTLLENELVYPNNEMIYDAFYDLIENDQLFSIIGTSNLFTRIKELVENNNLTQEWGVSKLPKNETFCYDVNLGGYSFMVVNNEEVDDDQYYVYDFLTQIFATDNDESCDFYNEVAEYYDMVPSTNYMVNKLNDLENDGCFYNQQVIKFLYDLSEDVPGIYYGEYSSELGNEFETIVEKVVDKTLTISDATTEFDDFCQDYLNLDILPELDYIEIETPPDKTIYYEYEVFDRTGMVVRAYFVDGISCIVTNYTVSPNTLSAGNTCVVVSYSSGGVVATAEQSINVYTRTVIGIEASPRKQYYLQTDTLSTNDFRVEATFDMGNKDYITEYEISPSTLNQTGNQVVTITYQKRGATCSCDVTIEVKRKLTSIGVITPPLMVNYIEGQYFNPTGMQVKAYYSDQTSNIINQYSYTPTTPLEYSEVPQEVQIRYVENRVECETIQSIMVEKRKLEKIEIENVRPNQYMAGEYIAESSVSVRAYYNDDTSKIVKDFELLVGKEEPLDEEDTEVEVSYQYGHLIEYATYPITVDPKILTSLRIKREPYRLIYEKVNLSNLDLSGLILSMSFNNKIWVDFNYDIYISNKTSEVKEENNQNFVSGNDISYEILESKTSKKQVLITYEGKNASFVVTDVGTTLQTMNITTQPNKRRYYVGETFEVDGMEVKGNFLEKKHPKALKPTIEVRDITSVCEVAQQPIQPGDKYVYVYYKNDKDEITNHTRVAITVEEKDVDNSKIDQTELTYSCDSGTARVNLFNRRLSFEHFDVSIGANTYTIACSHIYNSLFNEFTSLKYGEYMDDHYKTHMGKGFKLSIQQYLIYDETYERFIYTDSAGYRHYFVSLGDGVRYYDTTGTNLLLEQVGDQYLIYDLSGNKMYFENGVIVRSISCFKNNYAKIYEYDNGKLIKVYDKRKPSNTIIFEYDNETNLLSTIKCTKDGITKKELTYEYVLVKDEYCLSKIIDGDITTIFEYDNRKNLINTYHLETKSCLEFKYKQINNIFLIEEITSGIIDTSQKTITNNQIIQKNVIDSTNDGYKMTVRNQKKSYKDNATDVVMEYQFNVSGYTVSVLEENLGNPYQLKTLEKEPGIEINFPNQSTSDFTINTKNKYKYENGRMCYSKIYLQNFNEVNRYRQGKCNNYDNFTISFWAKLNYVLNDPKILVTIISSNSYVVFDKIYYDEGTAVLDNSAIGVWQYVTVPIKIDGENIKEVTISMALNFWQGVEICDVKLCLSPKSSLNVLSQDGNSFASVDNATKIVYTLANSEEEVEKEISDSYFITQDDLKYTVLNMYKTSINDASVNDNSFILSMCDGTKKALVKDASIVINNDGVLSNYKIGLKENSGEESYRALYSYDINSPDDEMTTSSYLDIYISRTIGNYTGPVIKGTTVATTSGKDSTTSSIYTYADFFGRVLQEVDEYEVTTTYQYNEFGEVTNKTISHSDTDETIEFTTSNTDTTTVEESKTSYNKTEYNNPLGYVESTTYNGYEETEENALTQTFTYNQDITRLEEVSNNLNGKNVLTYKNNRLSKVTPTGYVDDSSYGYKIKYDRYGNPSKYYLLSGVNKARQLLTENITDYQKGTITNKQYRQSETESDDVTIHLNKYGKTTSIVENSNGDTSKHTNFIYQTLEESSGAAQVSKMYDPYEDIIYAYSYDDYNKCTGYKAESQVDNFSVEKTGPNEVTYFGTDYSSRQSLIEYDSYKLMSPRIAYVNDIYQRFEDSTTREMGKVTYRYDNLGRVSSKEINAFKDEFDHNVRHIEVSNRYLPGTLLKDRINISIWNNEGIGPYFKSYYYKYDDRGRITRAYSNDNDEQVFTYDQANHLKTEKLISGDIKTYEYNTDGTIKSETTNNNSKVNYIYEKGRLIKKGNQEFTYDNIGNCLTYKGETLQWHRGTLLKQYGSGENSTKYSYDNQGVRFKKERNGKTTIFFHDGGKIIDEDRAGTRIRYLYDVGGIIGFWVDYNYYFFIKDAIGNVRKILLSTMYMGRNDAYYKLTEVAGYDYDAWGNCIVHQLTDDTIDGISVAEFNPIRWKSHYYDTESGLYYIDGRYYSPETKQCLNPANPETVLSSASTIYGLNLYTPTITNPLDIASNGYTIETTTELAYDPPELSKWKQFWRSTLGKVVAYFLANIAIAGCIITGNIPMLIVSAALLLGSLLIGSIVAGYQSSVKGKSFWRGFGRYINDNWAQSVAISSIMIIITIGISAISSGFKSIGSKQGS